MEQNQQDVGEPEIGEPEIGEPEILQLKKEQVEHVEEDLPDLFSSFLGLGLPALSEELDKKPLHVHNTVDRAELKRVHSPSACREQRSNQNQEIDDGDSDQNRVPGEKRAKRRQQVAAACRRSRAKKKRELEDLIAQVSELKTEQQKNLDVIEELRQQISTLRTKASGPHDELEELREENTRLANQLQQHVTFVDAFKGLVQIAPKETELNDFDKLSIGMGHTNTMNKRACVGMGVTTKSDSVPQAVQSSGSPEVQNKQKQNEPTRNHEDKQAANKQEDDLPKSANDKPPAATAVDTVKVTNTPKKENDADSKILPNAGKLGKKADEEDSSKDEPGRKKANDPKQ